MSVVEELVEVSPRGRLFVIDLLSHAQRLRLLGGLLLRLHLVPPLEQRRRLRHRPLVSVLQLRSSPRPI